MTNNKQHAITFIFITLLIDVIGLGIILPVLLTLIEELIHGTISDASRYGGWLIASYAIMQFIFVRHFGKIARLLSRSAFFTGRAVNCLLLLFYILR